MTNETLRGALRSRTVWWNVLLALLAGLEMMSANLTAVFGPSVAASILLIGAVANLVLRAVTTQALADKR